MPPSLAPFQLMIWLPAGNELVAEDTKRPCRVYILSVTSAACCRKKPICAAPFEGSKGFGQLKGLAIGAVCAGMNTGRPELTEENRLYTPALERARTWA